MVMLFLFVSVTMILLVNWEVEEPKRNELAQLISITITMDRHWIMVIIFNLKYLLITCTNLDIALLKLQSPVELNDAVCIICLPARGSKGKPGKTCTVTGYGYKDEGLKD